MTSDLVATVPGLLVSVRSAEEAESALAGGAALIDVKEPARGSLGRADDAVIAAVARAVAGRRPVSAALGELVDVAELPQADLAYVKWGLAGSASLNWRELLARAFAEVRPPCMPVAVAYADWQRAKSPAPEAVCGFALQHACGAFLIDTYRKDGTTLLDWLSADEIVRLSRRCQAAGVQVALAGSLGMEEIEVLREANPNWFAVRGSVCKDGRESAIDPTRVRRLVELLGCPAPRLCLGAKVERLCNET